MSKSLRLLIVEDSENDALLEVRLLRSAGYEVHFERVETEEAMDVALSKEKWDIVISDYSMPQFSGRAALRVLQRSRVDIPFIIVSGNMGEDVAVEAMKTGVHDYLLKNDLKRLVVAVEQAILATKNSCKRKKVEEDLKQEQALSNVIIDSIPGTFYLLDENGCYVRWNAYQRDEIVGKPEELVAGAKAIDTIHPDDRVLIQSKIANVLKNGGVEIVEGRVLLRGGPEFKWLLMTGRQMMIKGRPFLVGIGIDITERKKAEEILKKGKENAESASKAKSEFLNNIAHDFRTPMHAIMGLSTFFQSENATPKQREYANIINEKSKGLLTLIEELLDVSRLDAGKLELRSIEFDLKESVLEVVKTGADELMGKEVTLACSVEEGLPRIKADKIRFSQVLTNLIGNAIKYTDKGDIVVSVTRQLENCPAGPAQEGKCRVRVSIKDAGIGIPKDKQEKIFEAYTRFQEFDGTRERGGVGLGLYITKTLVELMGGTINVVSDVGVGSEFIVVLDFDLAGAGK